MPNTMNDGLAWAASLTKAVELGADGETVIRIADRAGEAVRRHNAAVEIFAMLGFDLPENRMMAAAENEAFRRRRDQIDL